MSSMNVTVRPYRNDDLDELVRCWNESLFHDVLTPERFMDRVVLDDNFDPGLAVVAEREGSIIGFCWGVRRLYPYLTRGCEPERGWIGALFVVPEQRRGGVGRAMLMRVESRMRELGISEITVGAYSPSYFMAGVDVSYAGAVEFFSSCGYDDRGEAVSMQRSLFGYELPMTTRARIEELRERGIFFRSFERKHLVSLVSLAENEFGAGWHKNIVDAVRRHEAEKTIIVALDASNEVIGFCMRKIDGNDERFGPIGVRHDLRSQGLGGILLDLQMLEMKKQGINCLYFLWTSGVAIRFYERHGFRIYRTYRLSRKRLDEIVC